MIDDIFLEDIKKINENPYIQWELFKDKTLFVTGATGLIGTTFIYGIDFANTVRNLNIKIIALVRDIDKAQERFQKLQKKSHFHLILGTVEHLPLIDGPIDYIVHAASKTASREFINHAVETIKTTVLGTIQILELAKEKAAKAVFLSSMEVYGNPEKGHTLTENEIGAMSPLNLRNSYPIGKIMAESLCCAYAAEYNVDVSIIRLAQTYGMGKNDKDVRVFAYFANCIRENKDIVLKTKGESERCYLHTNDAVSAILVVLAKGTSGQAYNAADEDTYCSIAEMARKMADANGIKVKFDIQDEAANGFPQTVYLKLNTTELKNLGWLPVYTEMPYSK